MQQWEYCELTSEQSAKDKRINFWVVYLYTPKGKIAIKKSEALVDKSKGYNTDFSFQKSHWHRRTMLTAELGLEGWEYVSAVGSSGLFRRPIE